MIEYPANWQDIGHRVTVYEIGNAITDALHDIGIRNLSLSGGIDSTLLLWFMKQIDGPPIHCYTIARDETHPDYIYAQKAADYFGVSFHPFLVRKTLEPDDIVRAFYGRLDEHGIIEIIAGDGIDEFSGGYYSHQKDQSEGNYIQFIRRLGSEHLTPLNENSGPVSVYLPYLSPQVVSLLSMVPLYEKVDQDCRKKLIVEMATGNIPEEIVNRWKYGFCDATTIKV
jgi:asparagine synthetase B (glutamine-hydrolysing)